ncbi:MAG: tetratricopeptide repeat protein [Elusimicrobiota bacterium]
MKNHLAILTLLFFTAACNRSPEYYFEQGNRLALSGRTMKSIEMYNKALLLKKKYPEALTSRAMVYEKLGDKQKAAYDYGKAIDMDPSYGPAYNNLAALYLDSGEYSAAVSRLSSALELDPSYAYAYLNRGIARYKLSDYPGSMADLTRAIELDPKLELARYQRALAAVKLGDSVTAFEDLNLLLNANTLSAPVWFERGRLKYNSKNYPGAIEDLKKAVELRPDAGAYLYWHTLAVLKTGRYEDALKDLDLTLQAAPAYARAWMLKGDVYALMRNLPAARESYSRALALDPANTGLYMARLSALDRPVPAAVKKPFRKGLKKR